MPGVSMKGWLVVEIREGRTVLGAVLYHIENHRGSFVIRWTQRGSGDRTTEFLSDRWSIMREPGVVTLRRTAPERVEMDVPPQDCDLYTIVDPRI